MNSQTNYTLALADKILTFQIGQIADQADGALMARLGDTMVLATAVMSKQDKENQGFFL